MASFFYLLALAFILWLLVLRLPSAKRNRALMSISIWVAIVLIIVSLYSFKDAFLESRIAAYIMPGYGYRADERTIIFKRSSDGHFYINAKVNGATVKFLLDTGASDVALTRVDAKRAGIDLDSLRYTKQYSTANGIMYAAPALLRQVTIRGITTYNVGASVAKSDMLGISLLGMGFLEDVRFSINNDTLVVIFN